MRLIDADTLKASYIITSTTTNSLSHLYVSLEDINNAPTVDAILVRLGRWKQIKAYPDIIFCSECGEPFERSNLTNIWNYCPNCGARMERSV